MVGIAGVFYREKTKRHLLLAQPRVAELDPIRVATYIHNYFRAFFMGYGVYRAYFLMDINVSTVSANA
jgi:hypothetical protein